MKLPDGLTEEQVLKTIDNISNRLAAKFKFGYHGLDDMKQQAACHALEVLSKPPDSKGAWDGKRPLENFLYICVHNLLFNDKRNKFERPDKPCHTCPFYDKNCDRSNNQCEAFSDKMNCELYASWHVRNNAKKNIMKPIDIGNVQDEKEENMRTQDHTLDVEQRELLDIIDANLDVKYRADYLRLKNNVKIPKQRRLLVEQAILEITREFYGEEGD